jgi:hypothetical protein
LLESTGNQSIRLTLITSCKTAGVEQPFKIGINVWENYNVETHPEVIPEVPLTAELFPEMLIGEVGQFKDLMHEEGKEVQEEKVE